MTQEKADSLGRITAALSKQYDGEEACDLARLLFLSSQRDSITYEDIDIPMESKDDIILLAYEERMLLPMKSRRGSAWEDRIFAFDEGEKYNLPRVVRFLVAIAENSGEWNPEHAVAEALTEAGENQIGEMVALLNKLIAVVPLHDAEVEKMQAISAELDINIDMHDTLDRFVRCGIISPRTQRSLHTGFARYEINPCLCWKTCE